MQNRIAIFALVLAAFTGAVRAQELDAAVVIDARPLSSTDRAVFDGFTGMAQDYLNSYRWTGTSWDRPRIRLSFQISISSVAAPGLYNAQLLVVCQRPGASGEEGSPLLRTLDGSWQFSYSRGQPIQHSPGFFNSLASLFDYYAYIALGLEGDTRAPLGGTEYFQKALDICTQGQSSMTNAGWMQTSAGTYGRLGFAAELVDARFAAFRSLLYSYQQALDALPTSPEAALTTLKGVVDSLLLFRGSLGGTSVAFDRFCDAKYLELAGLFTQAADKNTIYDELESIDPSHQSVYEQYRNR